MQDYPDYLDKEEKPWSQWNFKGGQVGIYRAGYVEYGWEFDYHVVIYYEGTTEEPDIEVFRDRFLADRILELDRQVAFLERELAELKGVE